MKIILAPLALLLAAGANAADFAADFNTTTNPGASGWTYGYVANLDDALIVHTDLLVTSNYLQWRGNVSGDGNPSAFKVTGTPTAGVLTGEAALHGGPNGEFSIARYTVPASGPIDVIGAFGAGDFGTVDVYVRQNGSTLFSALGTGGTEGFSLLGISATAGDQIDFVLGTSGAFFGDSTPLSATITAVPEPASMAVLGLGLAAMKRRRRNG